MVGPDSVLGVTPHLADEVSHGLQSPIQCYTALPPECTVTGCECTSVQQKLLFATWVMQESGLFQFSVYFWERKCHESCTSQIPFFRVKTCQGVLTTPLFTTVHIKRRDKSLATTRFLDPNTSRQITCLRNCRSRPIGWLAQQSALCNAAIADHYWKNQSHNGSVGTVVILSEMPSVVCTSINDDFLKILSQGWLVQGGSISSSAQFTAHCGVIKNWMHNSICYSKITETHKSELLYIPLRHFTLWIMSYVAFREEITGPTYPANTPLSQITCHIFCLKAEALKKSIS